MSEVKKCNKCGTVHSDKIDCQAELFELPFRCFETLDRINLGLKMKNDYRLKNCEV